MFISKSCSSLQASPEYCQGTVPHPPYVLTQLERQSQWAAVNLDGRKSEWKSHGNSCCHWGCWETGWANSSLYILLISSVFAAFPEITRSQRTFSSSISQGVMTCPSPWLWCQAIVEIIREALAACLWMQTTDPSGWDSDSQAYWGSIRNKREQQDLHLYLHPHCLWEMKPPSLIHFTHHFWSWWNPHHQQSTLLPCLQKAPRDVWCAPLGLAPAGKWQWTPLQVG